MFIFLLPGTQTNASQVQFHGAWYRFSEGDSAGRAVQPQPPDQERDSPVSETGDDRHPTAKRWEIWPELTLGYWTSNKCHEAFWFVCFSIG